MSLPRRSRTAAVTLAVLAAAAALAGPTARAQSGPPPGCTGPASSTWINVNVEGLRSSDGLLAITLYPDDPRRFLVRHGSLYVGRVPAHAGSMRACIFVPEPGNYVLALYHDENGNRKFDRSGLGLPAEGYGFSNNPPTIAGLPSFRAVRLSIPKANLSTRIQMKYP
ncbi:MAG: DUF2141 domain-containing protein [Novosphingobium sp.]|nr:DUF2141 domain-containing protein [Novosphingobium sp.]